jgi:Tol biopolymer transport system component/DNA-binding winged helix-turn-helix (wHTH) protein
LDSSKASTDRTFRFEPFELSERDFELRKNGVRIKLQDQPLRILLELVANAGRVVTREDLQQKLWLADTFVDFDVGLNTAMRKLRQALGDDAEEPRYIETQARRGYRFIAPVAESALVAPPIVTPVIDSATASQPIVAPVPNATGVAQPISGDSQQAIRRRRWVWMAVAGCVIAIGAVVAGPRVLKWWESRYRPSALSIVEINPLTESGNVFTSAVSRDGNYIAYAQIDAGKFDLRLLQVATGRVVQILPPSELGIIKLHFSPDGNFIYLLRQLENSDTLGVFRIATLGGPATPLATDARGRSLTVSPDGNEIAYVAQTTGESLIVAIDSQGGSRKVLAKRPLALGFRFIEWSPSPDKMAAVVSVPGTMAIGLTSVDLRSGNFRDLSVTGWGTIGQPAWSPDGGEIYAPAVPIGRLSPMIHIWEFDARTGDHKSLTSGSTQYRLDTLSSNAAGNLVALTKAPSLTLWATDAAGRPQQIPSTRSEGWDGLAWAGDRIVTDTYFEMIVHDPDGSGSTKLTADSLIFRQLARCGSGRVAYWAADAKRDSHIAQTDITTGATAQLTGGPFDVMPTCTPDGSTLVFLRCAEQGNRCYLTSKSLSSGQLHNLHEINPTVEANPLPVVSPDGAQVLFMKQDKPGDPPELVMTNPVTGGDLKTLKLPVNAADMGAFKWSPDGKSIVYSREDGGVGNIWSAPIEGKAATKLTDFKSDRIFSFDVSSDNRLAIARGNMTNDIVFIRTAK